MLIKTIKICLCLIFLSISPYAIAAEGKLENGDNESVEVDSLIDAFKEGKFTASTRFRWEHLKQDKKDHDANAKTLRTRLGFDTAEYKNLAAVIEFENTAEVGNDDYDNTLNGKTDHPSVKDIENTEVNQAYVQFTGAPDTRIRAGRQVINVDNERFIGEVGWRQNNQTFDAVSFENKSIEDTVLKYGYIYNVNRIFGEKSSSGDWESDSHYFNISNTSIPLAKITGYGYFLDFKDDSASNSSRTFGVSLTGKKELEEDLYFIYRAEFAHQSDYADNPTNYSAIYYHIAPGVKYKGLTLVVGKEVLGSDEGDFAFRTPIATGHKFNGWNDKFLTTPDLGLKDLYISLKHKTKGLEGKAAILNGLLTKFEYHDFKSEGGNDYGHEWGIYFKKPINKHVYVETKYAQYYADTISKDTKKFVLGVGIKY